MYRFTRRVGLVVAAAIIAGGSAVYAQLQQSSLMRISGTIAAISPQEHTLKLLIEPGAQPAAVFHIDAQTNITDRGQAVQLHELEVGEQVSIEYVAKAGKQLARMIRVEAADSAQPSGSQLPGASPGNR